MMGRISSSGYCHTCRRRRVKCDRGRPSCERCFKSGHTCRGYEIPFQVAKIGPNAQPSPRPHLDGTPTALQVQLPHTSSTVRGRQTSPSFTTELSLVAFQNELSLNYFLDRYRWAHWWKAILLGGLLASPDTAQYNCSQAIALGYIGSEESNSELRSKSLQLYGESLRSVSRALSQLDQAAVAGSICTIMTLGIYPYVMDKSLKLEHRIGIEGIVQACGPEYFQDKDMISIFRSCRSLLICQAFARRRETFCEQEAWKSLPFLKVQKTSTDYLYDILSHLPGLAESILKSNYGGFDEIATLKHHVECIAQQLRGWREGWDASNKGVAIIKTAASPATAEGVASEAQTLVEQILACEIEFKTLGQALEILMHNAGFAYLARLSEKLSMASEEAVAAGPCTIEHVGLYLSEMRDGGRPPLLPPRDVAAPWQLAMEAVQICGYIARELRSTQLGEFVGLAPVGILYCALKAVPTVGRLLAAAVASKFSATVLQELEVFGIWEYVES